MKIAASDIRRLGKQKFVLLQIGNFRWRIINQGINILDPNLALLGEFYQAENNLPAAIDAFWKSLRKNEDGFFTADYNLETIYKETKNYKGLTDLYKFLIARGKIEKYKDLVDIYEEQKLTALAKTTRIAGITALEMSIKLGKTNILNYMALSGIYESTNNLTKAELILKGGYDKSS